MRRCAMAHADAEIFRLTLFPSAIGLIVVLVLCFIGLFTGADQMYASPWPCSKIEAFLSPRIGNFVTEV